jgi:hypothetical protein
MNTHTNLQPHTKWDAQFIYLFICGLLYSALHLSDYTAQNGKMNDAWRIGKDLNVVTA